MQEYYLFNRIKALEVSCCLNGLDEPTAYIIKVFLKNISIAGQIKNILFHSGPNLFRFYKFYLWFKREDLLCVRKFLEERMFRSYHPLKSKGFFRVSFLVFTVKNLSRNFNKVSL